MNNEKIKVLKTPEEVLKWQIESNRLPTIHFVRHGQSYANAGGVTQPNAEIELTELGHGQARLVASMFPIETPVILTSEFIRTKQTAQYLATKANIKTQCEPLLNEFSTLCHTTIEGLNGAQRKPIIDKYWEESDPNHVAGLTAESFIQFASRVEKFRLNRLNELPHQSVVFGHGMWFAMLAWQTLGFDFNDSASMRAFRRYQIESPMPNCFSYEFKRLSSGEWLIKTNVEPTSVMS